MLTKRLVTRCKRAPAGVVLARDTASCQRGGDIAVDLDIIQFTDLMQIFNWVLLALKHHLKTSDE